MAPGPPQTGPLVVNGVQASTHQNGVSAMGDLEVMMTSSPQQQGVLVADPLLAFEGAEPYLMKSGAMKPQHVAGRAPSRLRGVLEDSFSFPLIFSPFPPCRGAVSHDGGKPGRSAAAWRCTPPRARRLLQQSAKPGGAETLTLTSSLRAPVQHL